MFFIFTKTLFFSIKSYYHKKTALRLTFLIFCCQIKLKHQNLTKCLYKKTATNNFQMGRQTDGLQINNWTPIKSALLLAELSFLAYRKLFHDNLRLYVVLMV